MKCHKLRRATGSEAMIRGATIGIGERGNGMGNLTSVANKYSGRNENIVVVCQIAFYVPKMVVSKVIAHPIIHPIKISADKVP